MSRSSISWHIGRLVGSSLPALPITPPPLKNGLPWSAAPWACIAGLNLIKNACRPAPHVVEHLPTSTPAADPEQLQPLQVIGVNSIRARLSATDHAPRACRAMRWVGAHGRVPLVPRSADVDDDSMPTTGRTQGGRDRSVVCLVTETGRDGLGVSGSTGHCPPDHGPAAGTRHHPKRMISRRPRPGRISPPKAVVSLTQGDGRCPRLDSMVRTASKARTR
jgi:hypothetical protein